MALCVFTGDDLVYERYIGYQNREDGVKLTPSSVLDWGSVTGDYVDEIFLAIPMYPAAMAMGTLEDFRTFAQALLEPGVPKLFQDPKTAETFFSPGAFYESGVPRISHGLWYYPFERSVVGHGGNTAACSSHLLLDRENGTGYVVMSNQQAE